ncbi:aspartic-type endopeptidase opsB [Penicillium diatomitis]|uniref:Probable aspartic-type endopeptidase OPSB n=1 Tax=Penicillium diatomitis TaxID=2819901 RepID=A0A9X0BZB4_9EURO|nr:aspartic-type endopeptidase opsB [Penicillium diatomitis]KAJ5491605.1 aspartic-type endopeptidase opsB [Penicillium diatomitis]
MKYSWWCAASLAAPAWAKLTLVPRDAPAVVEMSTERNRISNPVARDQTRRMKRANSVQVTLDNEQTLYFANVSLGTPKQDLRMVIDTGSSDLWVNAPNSTLCENKKNQCQISGTYDGSSSSTYKYVNPYFNITYADGSQAAGEYASDTLHIGGATLKDFEFGIGYISSSPAIVQTSHSTYNNLPKAMVDSGLIKSNAYSLWLNDLDANTGSILFGGVNTKKYHGSLQTLPIEPIRGIYAEFIIALTAVAMTNSSGTTTYNTQALPSAVLLDSGSSLSYLPNDIVRLLYNDLDVALDQSGNGYLPCRLASEDIKVSFTFTSPTIEVSMSELLLDVGSGLTFNNGDRACAFGIAPAGNSMAVLGDTFLRSAYVVYDLANHEISLAKTNFNSTEDHIVEIGTGTNAVPSATAVNNPVTSVAGEGSGGPRIGGPHSGTGVFSAATAAATTTSKGGAVARPTAMPGQLAALGMVGAGALLVL